MPATGSSSGMSDELDIIVDSVDQLKDNMATLYSGRSHEHPDRTIEETGKRMLPMSTSVTASRKNWPATWRHYCSHAAAWTSRDLANRFRKDILATGRMYAEMSDRLGIVWMNRCVEGLEVEGRWQALARSNLRDDFYRIRRDFAVDLLGGRSRKTPEEVFPSAGCTKNASISAEIRFHSFRDAIAVRISTLQPCQSPRRNCAS